MFLFAKILYNFIIISNYRLYRVHYRIPMIKLKQDLQLKNHNYFETLMREKEETIIKSL